jgi:DNA replication and repair protein RecF
VTIVSGENAKGKTSILEALYMLSRGKGFREHEEVELITFEENSGYIAGLYEGTDHRKIESSVTYQRSGEMLEKRYILDKTPVGLVKYRRSQVPVVLFAPHQIDIIVHGPSYRREYLNTVLTLTKPQYAKVLKEYESALRKRNAILEDHDSLSKLKEDLVFWDTYLAERADFITSSRKEYIDFMNEQEVFAGKNLRIQYVPNTLTVEKLQEKFSTESAARRTLIGPQKDDFTVYLVSSSLRETNVVSDEAPQSGIHASVNRPMVGNSSGTISQNINVHTFASRSQQRLALLWLKMRELEYLRKTLGMDPILLLDDMYSEFDSPNRHIITSLIPHYQTVITTTEEVDLPADIAKKAGKIEL